MTMPEIPGCDFPEPGKVSVVDGHCRCTVCPRCGHHTGNNHQGHYFTYCSVTGSDRVFHHCCPGDCELEAVTVAGKPLAMAISLTPQEVKDTLGAVRATHAALRDGREPDFQEDAERLGALRKKYFDALGKMEKS